MAKALLDAANHPVPVNCQAMYGWRLQLLLQYPGRSTVRVLATGLYALPKKDSDNYDDSELNAGFIGE